MVFVILLLDLTAIFLWLSFRRVGADPTRPAGTLLGNLRPAAPVARRSWLSLVLLIALVVLRPLLIAPLAAALDATPTWSPGPIVIAFRADDWLRLYLFSTTSFLWTALAAYSGLLGFCWLCRGAPELRSFEEFGVHLAGRLGRLPGALLIVLPIVIAALVWLPLSHLLEREHLLPISKGGGPWYLQSFILGSAVWLPVRWPVLAVLFLRMLHNHVYLGEHPFWTFVQAGGRRLQFPMAWLPLQIGRMDFAPLISGLLYWGVGEMALFGLQTAFSMTLR